MTTTSSLWCRMKRACSTLTALQSNTDRQTQSVPLHDSSSFLWQLLGKAGSHCNPFHKYILYKLLKLYFYTIHIIWMPLCFFYIYFKSNRKNPIFYFQIRIQHSVIVWSPVGILIGMQIISYWAKVASPKCYKILYLTPISIVIICLTRYYSNLRPPSAPHGNILGV